jgi:glycosyltransferase involved in cell wall biosynthesis
VITAIGMCKDEADIIAYTLAHLEAQGVDRFIVLDNGSTDGTREILEQFSCEIVDDPEPGYYQDRKMTALARRVTEGWVLPFDADELWYSPAGATLAQHLNELHPGTVIVSAPEYKHWPTPWDMPGDPNPFTRMVWREETPHSLHKVCFQARPDVFLHMGNHHVSFGSYNPDKPADAVPVLELRHFPYRSFAQFARKVRQGRQAYEAATTCDATTVAGHRMTGTHWKEMGALNDDELAELWSDATSGFACSAKWLAHGDLIKDPAPWA